MNLNVSARWKIRKVTENFIANNGVPKLRLECGHIMTDPMLHYGNEKAYAIGVLGATIVNNRRVRCYQCAKKAALACIVSGGPDRLKPQRHNSIRTCSRCGEEVGELDPDGCRDPDCPLLYP